MNIDELVKRISKTDGLSKTLGMHFISTPEPDTLQATMKVDERNRQPFGFLSGGASLALAENVAGIGSLALCPGQIAVFSDDYRLQGPYTMTAAHLCHLRTDIHFRLPCADVLGDVLEALYPTPAVCGIPKEPARRFILRHEHEPRRYYSGFVGMLSPRADTHLFVSLRCMRLLPWWHLRALCRWRPPEGERDGEGVEGDRGQDADHDGAGLS